MLIALAASAAADRIQLTDGRVLQGTVRHHPPGDADAAPLVTIEMTQGAITLPANQIQLVAETTAGEDALIAARDHLRQERPAAAIVAMEQLVEGNGSLDGLAMLLIEHGPAVARAADTFSPEQTDALRRVLAAIDAADLDGNPDLSCSRLWLRLALDDSEGARPLISRLCPLYFDANIDRRRQLGAWIVDRVDRCAETGGEEQGRRLLDALSSIDPALAEGRRVQFYLHWARRLRQSGEFEQALLIYGRELMPSVPEIAREFVRRTLTEADHSLDRPTDQPRLVRLYEDYGLRIAPEMARERLVQIWRNAGWSELRRGEYEPASAAFARANAVVPGSADKDLWKLEFRRRRAGVAADDLLGRYELGIWANNQRLDEEALAEFRAAVASPIVGDNARAYIEQVMNRRAERELENLMNLYDAGRHQDTLNGILRFQEESYAEGYQQQAARINELTVNALQIALAERPQQAMALYQQAERAFYQDRLDEASEKLKAISENYKDTLVYAQARNLYARVRQKQSLHRLEHGVDRRPPAAADMATSPTPTQSPIENELDELYRSLEKIHRNAS
jgi:tetratricopeptide (TPR) repeat protein